MNFGRDSLVGIAVILHLMSATGQTVSGLVADLPPFFMLKRQLPCPLNKIAEVLRRMKREFAGYPLDLRDGVKVMLPEGWFLLRGSNTEPVVRLVVEAASEAEAAHLCDAVMSRLQAWR